MTEPLHGRIVATIAAARSDDGPWDQHPIGIVIQLRDGERLAAPLTIEDAKVIVDDLLGLIAEAEATTQSPPDDLRN